jgi:uncharacterized protein YdeI (YjbR/CyaY-like superfamily)
MLPLSAENRTGANGEAGDEIEVEFVLDDAPREVTLPSDFNAALDAAPDAKRVFEGLSYGNKDVSCFRSKTPRPRKHASAASKSQ